MICPAGNVPRELLFYLLSEDWRTDVMLILNFSLAKNLQSQKQLRQSKVDIIELATPIVGSS